jgi:hypothetical protein
MTQLEIAVRLIASWTQGRQNASKEVVYDAFDLANDILKEDHIRWNERQESAEASECEQLRDDRMWLWPDGNWRPHAPKTGTSEGARRDDGWSEFWCMKCHTRIQGLPAGGAPCPVCAAPLTPPK